ncbi:Vacuolar protease A [Boothiomyces sp. JEL0838]|nr:Vacuolar protease A [Boothiomyces sp. JEL0838]KAJ3314452.1 Vacuolar protease A [Boothiomyces sp. JEL0838]
MKFTTLVLTSVALAAPKPFEPIHVPLLQKDFNSELDRVLTGFQHTLEKFRTHKKHKHGKHSKSKGSSQAGAPTATTGQTQQADSFDPFGSDPFANDPFFDPFFPDPFGNGSDGQPDAGNGDQQPPAPTDAPSPTDAPAPSDSPDQPAPSDAPVAVTDTPKPTQAPNPNPAPPAAGNGKSSELQNQHNDLYIAQVTIGSQKFNIDLDTGSADVWVRGKSCQSNDNSCGGNQPALDTNDKTISSLGVPFSVQYGSGAVKGNVFQGPVELAGLVANNLPFGVSTQETGFGDAVTDGLLGMAFDSISNIAKQTGKPANFFDALGLPKGKQLFSFFLSDSPDGNKAGQITLGGVDETKFQGEFTSHPLNSDTFWQFDVSGMTFQVGDQKGDATGGLTDGIADSGTTLLAMTDDVAAAINGAIGGQQQGSIFVVDCAKRQSAPPLVLNFGGHTYSIPPSIYIRDLGNQCFSGVSGGISNGEPIIFGDTFMRQFYTVFDVDNKQVKFAISKQ